MAGRLGMCIALTSCASRVWRRGDDGGERGGSAGATRGRHSSPARAVEDALALPCLPCTPPSLCRTATAAGGTLLMTRSSAWRAPLRRRGEERVRERVPESARATKGARRDGLRGDPAPSPLPLAACVRATMRTSSPQAMALSLGRHLAGRLYQRAAIATARGRMTVAAISTTCAVLLCAAAVQFSFRRERCLPIAADDLLPLFFASDESGKAWAGPRRPTICLTTSVAFLLLLRLLTCALG